MIVRAYEFHMQAHTHVAAGQRQLYMTSTGALDGRPAVFTKDMKTPLEAELQDVAASHDFAPKILRKDGNSLQMEYKGQCLADIYGDDATEIPDDIWERIEHMLAVLFEREGIEYVDITSYNFLEDTNGNIWIIDFGDAYYTSNTRGEPATNWFLRSVLAGDFGKAWNPDFA